MSEHYLDNAATTRPCAAAVAAMQDMAVHSYGNPSSLHRRGFEAEQRLKLARRQVADGLRCNPEDLVFTGSGTEAINTALLSLADRRRGDRIVSTDAEHPAVLETLRHLAQQGFSLTLLPTVGGCPDLAEAERAITDGVALVSMMLVNNETGARFPAAEVGALARRAGARYHVDAVQGFGKLPFSPGELGCDALSVSAHKIGGLKGTGALWVKEPRRLKPLIRGGGQEGGLRSGTENMPGIAAFGAAVQDHFARWDLQKTEALYDRACAGLLEQGCVLNRPPERLPTILNFSVPGLRAEPMLNLLSERGVYVSAGSACSARQKKHSPVLLAMGLEERLLEGALRVSFGIDNDMEDVEALLEGIAHCRRTLVNTR
ncbi:MAG: cysteine desulfurase [Clostridiales bacterium]|nr:cysteine desulfurase [Clostridiales bacterium]